MIGWIRLIWRIVAVAVLTGGVVITLHVGHALLRLRKRPPARFNGGVFKFWSRWVCRLLGIRRHVEGTPPQGSFLLVSNHLSYLDIPVLASELGAIFVAKSEIASWPIAGYLCRLVDTVFVDRGSRRAVIDVGRGVERILEDGGAVVIFPEGTSTSGREIISFRSPLFAVPAKRSMPVHYACVGYRTPDDHPPAHLAVCWWGDMEFMGHVMQLLRLPRVDARVSFGETPISAVDRKDLAARLHGAVTEYFVPVVTDLEEA